MHQFKKTLQTVKPSRHQAGELSPILVACSGGASSWALMSFFEQLLRQDARKMHFAVHGVWVDCLDVLPMGPGDAAAVRAQMAAVMAASPFGSFRRVPLCAAFSPATLEPDEKGASMEKLKRVFAGSRRQDVTWKEDLMAVLVRSLLLRCAQRTGGGCSRIATGETMTRCCVKLLAGMSRGLGANAALTVAGVDPVTFGHLNVMLVRPLVGLTAKEIVLYLRAIGRPLLLPVPAFSTMAGDKRHSVSLLSETFLLSLQSAHDHTLATLIKSAQKIESPVAAGAYCREWANCMGCEPAMRKAVLAQSEEKRRLCSVCWMVPPLSVVVAPSGGCCGGACDCSASEDMCRVCSLLVEDMAANNNSSAKDIAVPVRDQVFARIADCLLSDDDGAE